MGFLRKATFVATGGASGLFIKGNSKKERTAKALEKQVRLQKAQVRQERRAASQQARANRQANGIAATRASAVAIPPPVEVAPAIPMPASQPSSVADELAKLAQLRDQGILTTEEFETEKAKVLAR